MKQLYDENDEQRKIILAEDGYNQCVAGAGAGKTRSVIYKIAYEIQHKKRDPKTIIALTFTKKAAKEMQQRLAKFIGKEKADLVYMSTIHAYCYRLIKNNYKIHKNLKNKLQRKNIKCYDKKAAPFFEDLTDSFMINVFGQKVYGGKNGKK